MTLSTTLFAINPYGSRLDRGHGSDMGGVFFIFIIIAVVGLLYLMIKKDHSSQKKYASTRTLTESERWNIRIKQIEKEEVSH